ncbi:MAG: hypothetical protein GTO22_03645, partial [Gemmatimonadales bacterium]|nr:hypothetical protein [Gemmatimonadales bacterium]
AGASGQQPGTNDATLFFEGVSLAEEGEELSGVTISNSGNTELKPERS